MLPIQLPYLKNKTKQPHRARVNKQHNKRNISIWGKWKKRFSNLIIPFRIIAALWKRGTKESSSLFQLSGQSNSPARLVRGRKAQGKETAEKKPWIVPIWRVAGRPRRKKGNQRVESANRGKTVVGEDEERRRVQKKRRKFAKGCATRK